MMTLKNNLCFAFLLAHLISSVYGVKCISCNSTADNDACYRGFVNTTTKECISEEICAAYQYDVYLNDKRIGTGTVRGCEKNKNYCGIIEDMINTVVQPARVKEKKCFICEKDLCNTSTIIVPYFCLLSISFILSSVRIFGVLEKMI